MTNLTTTEDEVVCQKTHIEVTVWWLPERREWGQQRVEGVKYMVTEDDLTLGGGRTMQCTDGVSQNCTLEPNVTAINLMFKNLRTDSGTQ